MRALPMTALLLVAACANGADPSKTADQPGVGVAEAALRSGAAPLALRIDDEILAKDPNNVPALINRGDAQTASQQFDAAAQSYAAALHADSTSVQARIGLARMHLADDPHAAETLFLEALQRDPRNAVALNDLGIARDLLGHHAEAQAAYRQALGIDSSMHGAQVNLALSMAMAGQANEAAPMLRPLADAPNASRQVRDNMAAVLAMGGDRSGAQQILAQNLPPEQVDQAIAIFAAASPTSGAASPTSGAAIATSGAARATGAAPGAFATQVGGPANSGSAAGSLAGVASVSAAATSVIPVSAAPASAAVASAAPASVSPASAAPASAAPASAASTNVTAVSAAALSAAPASVVPPASVALASVAPASAAPVVATPITAGPENGSAMVQLSTTATRDAATADWRRIQHHLPDLLALHQPVFVQTGDEANVRWGVRTGGFTGLEDAKGFCSTIKARGFSCFATLARNLPAEQADQADAIVSAASLTPATTGPTDAGPRVLAAQAGGQPAGSPTSAAPTNAAPTSAAPISAVPISAAPISAAPQAATAPQASAALTSADPTSAAQASAGPSNADLGSAHSASGSTASGSTMVQLSTTATRDAAKADWRRIQHHLSDLLADRQPAFVQTDTEGNQRWGVRTGGFDGYAAARDFCDTIKARGFGCFVTGS
jgi:Flp pilus assembly protein TadD